MRIAWVDVETTGLVPQVDSLLAVGCVVTDERLQKLAAEEWVVWQPEDVLAAMDDWCLETHVMSGLVDKVRASELTEDDVRGRLLAFLDEWAPGTPTLAGSSVHFDRGFLEYHFGMRERFHHRHLDVSVLRVVAELVAPAEAMRLTHERGATAHMPLADIEHALKAFGEWRRLLFRQEYW